MVVHIKDTSIAGWAMMTSLRLKNIAHEAVAPPLIFIVAQVETPKHWHLARIRRHGLEKRPEKHKEDHIVNDEEATYSRIAYR